MCPACVAMVAMITAGVASTGALGLVLAKTARSQAGFNQTTPNPESKERSQDDNHRN
jgi:hypothetical protein